MTKKASYITLGCKLNYAETSTYERGFMKEGYESVPWSEKADLYVINTCSVTEHADRKSRNIIRKIHRTAPDATVIVTGCYAQLKRAEVESLEGVSLVFGANEKGSLVKTTLEFIDGRNVIRDNADVNDAVTFAAYSSGEERTRSFLKVQDGCDNFCAYCTVPFARGRSRSISIAEAVEEAKRIATSGVREIVLTGVNTGDFGRKSGESFLDLLKALNDVEGIERYRISSIEPNLLTDEIVDWIASGTKFQPHFHIPLQSGSDTLLKDVGRKYSTYNFLKDRVRPAFIHIFPYSRRAGTRSAARKDQVQDCVKTKRVAMLEELCKSLNEEFIASQKGVKERVLFEESNNGGMMSGYTGNYIKVERPWDEKLAGQIVEVTL